MTTTADLTPEAILAAEEAGVRDRRKGEVDAMRRLLDWCDVHSVDPQSQPGAVPVKYGGNRLVQVGGSGTPKVAELCFEEFAIASHAGVIATHNRAADFLDLRHRLPQLLAAVLDLRVEVWVARKVASMSRRLTPEQAALVDDAVAAAADQSGPRMLAIAEAKVIEADVEGHRARIAADAATKGVWTPAKRPGQMIDEVDGEADVQPVRMRLSTAGAVGFTETVDAIAEALAAEHVPAHEDDVQTMDQFRAEAAELMADPHAAARFLDGLSEPTDAPTPRRTHRKPATIVINLDGTVLCGCQVGVARVEGIGPLLLEQVAELVRHRNIVVKPVIDLRGVTSVNGYEHPTACKERTELRTVYDVFPHSTSRSTRRLDHDHPKPYVPPDKEGPPGQTGDHNDAPLVRRDHRAKTHVPGYRVRQLGLGAYRWETPQGLLRVVTPRGTVAPTAVRDPAGRVVGELYAGRTTVLLGR
jgi:hypothetical protein